MSLRSRHLQDLSGVTSLNDSTRRRLYEYVAARREPVGRDEAAAAIGIGRTLAAYHLDKLAEHGLLEISYQRLSGRTGPGAGRPAKLYVRSQRELAISVPPRDYPLAGQLLAEAAERDRSGLTRRALSEAARELGARIAAPRRRRAQGSSIRAERRAIEATLRDRGYEPFEDRDGTLRLRNCPFHELAQQHQDVVCTMNLSLVEGMLAGLETRAHHASFEPREGCCCVTLQSGAPRPLER